MKALVVDDESDIGLMLSRILTKAGLQSEYVDRIEKAKELMAQEQEYDIYFLDLNLPDGTGFDLVPLVKQRQAGASIYFISAYDGAYEKNKAEELEVTGFIKKPFSKADILKALEAVK